MKISFLFFSALLTASVLQAQNATVPADKEAAYTKTITSRAEKIVTPLAINDAAKKERVTKLVVAQYRSLNDVYTRRDEQVKAAKADPGTDKEALAATLKTIEEKTTTAVASLHKTYLENLAADLSEEQVVKIKDGMTYGVLPITYKGYQDMLPNLTDEQKVQIMRWLVEAREYAMSAESSDKKHWWFGKYKGRINNYLSAAGYDLKKESEAWHKRMAAAKEAKSK
jgi:hypothetical protein